MVRVHTLSSATSQATIESIRASIATHGIPDIIVSDNGSCFTSQEFELFCRSNGITHIKSAPYHPASNGLAERMVQMLKQGLEKMEVGTFQEKLQRVLMAYRNTPHTTTGITPAELLLGRKPQTSVDLAKPNIAERVRRKQSEQKQHHDNKARNRSFSTQQDAYVRNFGTSSQWIRAQIREQHGPLSFTCRLQDGRIVKRHQDHIKARYKREENVADTNCTPEDKRPVIYEGDVGEPAAHAQEKQKETHQQTGRDKKRPINKQKSGGEILKERRANKFRHRRRYKQTTRQRRGKSLQRGTTNLGSDQRILLERKRGNPK